MSSRDPMRAISRMGALAVGVPGRDGADGTVMRVDPTRLLPAGDPIPVGKDPAAIAAGDNFVWTANTGDSSVTRIAPTTGSG